MKDDTIVYFPNRSYSVITAIAVLFSIFFFVLSGYALSSSLTSALVCILFAFTCTFLGKWCYNESKLMYIFDADGLHVINNKNIKYRLFSWKDFTYCYRAKGFKGHCFFVLSPSLLRQEHLRTITNRAANTSSVFVENTIVIYIDALQDCDSIKALISNKVVPLWGDGEKTV